MKLERDMYVRIRNDADWCCIGKIYNINDFREPSMKYCIDIQSDDFIFIPEDIIVKVSHNIIDVIEVGDYVNGFPVIHKENDILKCGLLVQFKENEIKSIVTKEQFESMSYKVN